MGIKHTPTKFKQAVGQRLRSQIEYRFGKRKEYMFAKQIKISQGSLSDILNGNSSPSAETLVRIHNRGKINMVFLLTGDAA